MATLNKVYTFTSSNEGFSLTNTTWNSTDGALENLSSGRNTQVDGLATMTGTYGGLGIPTGSTISGVELQVRHRLKTATATSYAYFTTLFDGTAISPQYDYNVSAPTSWLTRTGSRTVNKVPADTFSFSIDSFQRNLNDKNALTVQQFDNVTLIVTYEPPITIVTAATNLTGAGTIEATLEQFKSVSANLTGAGAIEASLSGAYAMQPTLIGSGELTAESTVVLFDGYIIIRTLDPFAFTDEPYAYIPYGVMTYEDCNVSAGNTYYYMIKRYRRSDGVESDYSNIAEIEVGESGIVTVQLTFNGEGTLLAATTLFKPAYTNVGGTIVALTKAQANVGGVIVNLTKAQQNIGGVITDIWISE